jgi:hypothetical protein
VVAIVPIGVILAAALVAAPGEAVCPHHIPAAPPAPERSARPPGTPTTLYVNFGGAVLQTGCGNDPRHNCSTLFSRFDGYVGPSEANNQQKWGILQAAHDRVSAFGITIVTDRPPDDVEYSMVIYGDIGEQTFAGVAPYIDCEDRWGPDTSFSGDFDTSNTGSTIILHEAGHTWGLEHVATDRDILNPFKTSNTKQYFDDTCHKVVANTDLEPAFGSCNRVHTRFCPLPGYQNTWQELLYLFGPALPDVEPPTFEIVSPLDGTTYIAPATPLIIGHIDDDRHAQNYEVTFILSGFDPSVDQMAMIDHTVELAGLGGLPPDDYVLTVRVADEAGNETSDTVSFTILPEGSELPGDEEAEAIPDEDSGCRALAAPVDARALLFVLLAVRRRRRA